MSNGLQTHATIRSIADKVGVAPCTVSAVLCGQARQRRVGAKTERKVLDVAHRLGYTPNVLAQGLRQRRTGVIGVLFADFTNNWADRVMTGMDPVLDRTGHTPLIAIHRWNPVHEARILDRFLQRRVDGIIGVPLPGSVRLYEDLRRRGVPMLFLSDTLDETPWAGFVAWDSAAATQTAVRHLLGIGRRRIALLHQNWASRLSGRIRIEAFHAELRAAGAEDRPEWTMSVAGDAEVEGMIQKVFVDAPPSERPDAIYANNDGLAFCALTALRRLGLRVPEDVAVVGMGDLPRGDDSGAGLSSVREPCEELGRLAAEAMNYMTGDRTSADSSSVSQIFVSGDELIVRRSTTLSQSKPHNQE